MEGSTRNLTESGIDTGNILHDMETFRITSKSGVVIADGLPVSAPSIQLHEGIVSKGNKPPKDLLPGESSTVAYPLIQGRLVCRVTRTVKGVVPEAADKTPIEFVEPDPAPKSKPKVSAMLERQTLAAIEDVKVRRGKGRKSSS